MLTEKIEKRIDDIMPGEERDRSTEYQPKKMKEYVLPETVYKQAVWAAKDFSRMKKQLMEMQYSIENIPSAGADFLMPAVSGGRVSDVTGRKATEMVRISQRIESIEKALSAVPLKYRSGIRSYFFDGVPYGDEAHRNTWTKWQQIFIYHVAINLGIY